MPDNVFQIQGRTSWRERSEMLERELEISQADVARLREQIRRMRERNAIESTDQSISIREEAQALFREYVSAFKKEEQ